MTMFQLFAARDGDTLSEIIDTDEARDTGLTGTDEEVAEKRAHALICAAFRLDDPSCQTFEETRAECDGVELVDISYEAARRVSASLQPQTDKARAERGLALLIEARELFTAAGNKQTLARVKLAISSARGAVRIQDYRATRAVPAR